jgi:hypothetical protein
VKNDLAEKSPHFGQWVWLVGDVVDHEPQTQRLFPARVLVPSGGGTRVELQAPINLQAFSGAPVVDSRGRVVGLMIGGDAEMSVISPAGNIRARLAESGVR